MKTSLSKHTLAAGRELLAQPLLPLARIVAFLYLTGPFERIEEILLELPAPIETGGATYSDPAALLQPHLPVLKEYEQLKFPAARPYRICDATGVEITGMESLELWVSHQLLVRELERINSLLCAPCDCTLCCSGPTPEMRQDFFEIPLRNDECSRFPLSRIDDKESRSAMPCQEPPLRRATKPFYELPPALYHWQSGWSLILPRNAQCPQLESDGRCRIYAARPEICRRPQIFSYVLEEQTPAGSPDSTSNIPQYVARRKLLAVWDCPYVRILKDEIAAFAEMGELEPVFSHNKS